MEGTPVTLLPEEMLAATYACLQCGHETIWRQHGQGLWLCTVCGTRDDSDEDLDDVADGEIECPALGEALELLLLAGHNDTHPLTSKELCSGLIYEGSATTNRGEGRALRIITGCRLLAGAGTDIAVGVCCALIFTEVALFVVTAEVDWAESSPYDAIQAFELGGPWAVQMGGGVGTGDALTGPLAAQLFNDLRQRTEIPALIRMATPDREFIFSHQNATPERLRLTLSPGFVRLAVARHVSPGGTDIATQLTQLAALKTTGHLTAAEFEIAKAIVLKGTN